VYRISNRRQRSPLRRRTHWELFVPLEVEAMRAAAASLLGEHDFAAFQAADCESAHAVRELLRVEVQPLPGAVLGVTVEGTAFVKHMVRNIVGTLVEVGRGRQPAGWVRDVLASRDRAQAGPTAPAHGLTLAEVFYVRPW
jgi:tRNA pseudouridine38-40 synthase